MFQRKSLQLSLYSALDWEGLLLIVLGAVTKEHNYKQTVMWQLINSICHTQHKDEKLWTTDVFSRMSVQNVTHSHLTWCFSHTSFFVPMDLPIFKDFKLSQQLSVNVNPPTVLWHCEDKGCNPVFSNANGSNLMNEFSTVLNRRHYHL